MAQSKTPQFFEKASEDWFVPRQRAPTMIKKLRKASRNSTSKLRSARP
jgi:hypothetical protein